MATIDESVVKLSLDDRDFDKASDKTIKKLDDLKKSLQFDGAAEGFKEIEKAARKTDFSPMEKGIQKVSNQFNALYTIADATLRRAINNQLDTLERTLKSLTIDNVTAGWSKYADKTIAVQTIMAATANQFENTSVQMEYVENQLEKLNWFTDETSYAFLDMVNNIGKFTSNNIALDKAATAMQGISTWAAISGAGIQGASHAMYNLAQAIGLGAVTLMDWKSIELANMGTVEFKQMAMEVAAARGEIKKLDDTTYQTLKGTNLTIETFRDTLSEKWFNSDVLIDVLNLYGGFADELYKLAEITDMSATPLIRYINEYKEGTLDLNEAIQATGLSSEELTEWLEKLASDEYDLGRRAFAAAQEAKTFQEAIEATKEAVSTGWMNTFEIIFGNYEEAKELWSDLAEGLYEVFVESGNARNGLLRLWKEADGRKYLMEGLYTLFGNLADAVAFVGETFKEIFPPKTADDLVDMTIGFQNLIEALTPGESTINAVHNVLTLLFTILKKIGQVSIVVIAGLEPIWKLLGEIGGAIAGFIGDIARLSGFNLNAIFSDDNLTTFYNILYAISSLISYLAHGLLGEIVTVLVKILSFGNDIWTTFREGEGGIRGFVEAIVVNFNKLFNTISGGKGFVGILKNIIKIFEDLFNRIRSGESIINKFFDAILFAGSAAFKGIAYVFQQIFEGITGQDFESSAIAQFFRDISAAIEKTGLVDNLSAASMAILNFASSLLGSVADLDNVAQNLKTAVTWIVEQFRILWEWLTVELQKLTIRDVADVALVIVISTLINSLRKFTDSLSGISKSFKGVLESVSGAIEDLSGDGIKDKINDFVKDTKYAQMAVAIGVMVNGLIELTKIPTEQLGVAVAAIGIVLGLLIGLMAVMEKLAKASSENDREVQSAADKMIRFATSIGILSAAVRLLASQDLPSIAQGVIALGAVMAEVAGFAYLLTKINPGDQLAKVSSSMIVMATGIGMLSASVAILSLLDIQSMLAATAAVAGLMLAFGGAAKLIGNIKPSSILSAAASIDIMAAGIIALSVPIIALSLLDLEKLKQGIISVSIVLAEMALACIAISNFGSKNAGGMLASAAVIISFAAAIDILVIAFGALALVSWDSIWKGLTVVAVAIGGLTAAAIVANTFAVGLAALAAVFTSVGVAFAMFAVSVKVLADAAKEFAIIIGALIAAGELFGDDFPKLIEGAMKNVELIIRSFLRMIPALATDIAAAATTLFLAIQTGFLWAAPDILTGMMILLTLICDVIANYAGPLLAALTRLIENLTPGIPALLEAFGPFIQELFAGLGKLVDDAVIGLIRGGLNAVGLHDASEAFSEFANKEGKSIGQSTVDGLVNGLVGSFKLVNDIGESIGQAIIDAMAIGAGVQSPSWKAALIALGVEEGFINEIESLMPNFEDGGFDTTMSFFSGAVSGAEEGGNAMLNVVDSFLQILGAKTDQMSKKATDAMKLSTEAKLRAQIKEGKLLGYDVSDLEAELANLGKKTGQAYSGGVAAGTSALTGSGSSGGSKSSGSSAAKAVKTAAEQIIESYKSALEQLDYLDKKYKGEYDLWSILNIDISEVEKRSAELEYVNKQIETQVERTRIAEEKYHKIAKAMGEASKEARDAEVEWIEQQVSLAKLQNERVELQNKTIEEAAKQLELQEKNAELTYNLWVSSNKEATQAEKLEKQLAYTMEKLEYSSKRVTTATEEYNKALEKYGEEATETKEALNELLETQKDYADISQEVVDTQKEIIDLETETAELALSNQTLQYELWAQTNKTATSTQKWLMREAELNRQIQYHMEERNKAAEEYQKICEKGLESSLEGQQAYQKWIETQMTLQADYDTQLDYSIAKLDEASTKIETMAAQREAMNTLWENSHENATKEEKLIREEKEIAESITDAWEQLTIEYENYLLMLKEYGKDADETLNAWTKVVNKMNEIQELTNRQKDSQLKWLEYAMKDLEFEKKRLSITNEIWEVSNKYASDQEKHAHNVQSIQNELLLTQKEINNLADQYTYYVKRYGEASDEARNAWYEWQSKQKEFLELQNRRKEVELEILDIEKELADIASSRAQKEHSLWEALNQDANDSEKQSRKLTYQMQSLEASTAKLRNASAKYNVALKQYGADAKETQKLFNEMLDAQIEYAQTYNELKSIQQEIITKNNDILEQLQYSEKLLDYGYNMWEKLNDDISDAQKIEAQIKKLGQQLTLQVQKANYYGAEWKRAVAKYGQNSAEAQEAYLAYLEALYNAVDLQSSLAEKETSLTDLRAENAEKLKEAWAEVTAKDLAGGSSIYDELVEMGLSEAEIEAYVKEKAGIIEDNIDTEMDFSIDKMQQKAEESLREWGMTWMDGVYDVADNVSTTASSSMDEMTRIIAEGANQATELMANAMDDINDVLEDGSEEIEDTVDETGDSVEGSVEDIISSVIRIIESRGYDVVSASNELVGRAAENGANIADALFPQVGMAMDNGVVYGIESHSSRVYDAITRLIEDALRAAENAAEIHSPSRITTWMGTMLDAGFIEGIEKYAAKIALAMSSAVQNGIDAMANVVHTSNTFDYVNRLISDGIIGGFENYSYNVLSIGQSVLDELSEDYDATVNAIAGENAWLLEALREYGFDETTHGLEFVVNLNADEARTELEKLFDARENDIEYYDELLDLQERNAEKDQSDLAVRAEAQAIARELNRVLASIESYEKNIEDIVSAGKAGSFEDSLAGKKFEYIQNIYSSKPLSNLDIYRNTNRQLSKFTAWR